MKKITLFCLALAALLVGCSDDEEVVTTGLSVSYNGAAVSSIEFTMGSSFRMLSIDTDGEWQASLSDSDGDWISLTPHEGYGWEYADTTATNYRSYIKLTVEANRGESRSTTLTVTAGSYSVNIPITQRGSNVDANDPFESAFDMVANLRFGYNLGNTLDANPDMYNSPWLDFSKGPETWETSWGQPVTTQEIIDDIASQGFNIIRIPVTWYPHMDENDNIDAAWMERVKEVVDYVLNAGCYCIVNVQHDTGSRDAGREDDAAWLYADLDAYPTQTVRYQKIWQQVATEFRDYGEKLIFESFNEILNKNYSWTAPSAGDGAYTAINALQQDFVNTVRATGGNNEYRNLAITTYSATGGTKTCLDELALPEDVHPNHIYGSIHSYDPYNFCNNNSGKNDDGSEYDWNILIFDSSCEEVIDEIVIDCYNCFNELGIPFIFGEFGAIDEEKSMSERVKYATYVATKMKQYNTAGLWWMGLYDRSTHTWYEQEIVNALFAVIE